MQGPIPLDQQSEANNCTPAPTPTNIIDAGAESAAGDDGRHSLFGVVEDCPAGDSRGGRGSEDDVWELSSLFPRTSSPLP